MIIALIIVLAAGATIVKSSSSSSPASAVVSGTRAVVVPTADAVRTVVVVPCGTGASVLSANASLARQTTGSTSLEFPQGGTDRVVVIPPCAGGRGGAAGPSALPSAAFVTAPGTPPPSIGTPTKTSSTQAGAPDSAQFELTVPAGSPIRTIVLAPCQKPRPSGPAEQILSASGRSSTAVAPAC